MRSTKKQIEKRRENLLSYLKDQGGRYSTVPDSIIVKELEYSSKETLKKDLAYLESDLSIYRQTHWSEKKKRNVRLIYFVDKNEELVKQTNYDYLESTILSNPQSFVVRCREGYLFKNMLAEEYINLWKSGRKYTIGKNHWDTGVWMVDDLRNLPKQITFHKESIPDELRTDDDRKLAF